MDRLSTTIKANAEQLLNDVHDTFARDIIVYKQAQQVIINTNPKHNFLFSTATNNTTVQNTIVSGVFKARILYGDKQTKSPITTTQAGRTEDQTNIKLSEGLVRIKVDIFGANFIKDATRITIDDTIFTIDTDARPHGLFDPKYYTFYLKRLQ